MNIITTALNQALAFYFAALPILILNMYIFSKKRKILNLKYNFFDKIFMFFFITSLLFALSVTIGNNGPLILNSFNLKNINLIPFDGIYMQYLMAIDGDLYSIINLFGNIIIFIPFGFFLAVYFKSDCNEKFKITIIAILISFSIEFIQLFQGRYVDITDIILNTTGVLLGRLIFCYFKIIFEEFFKNINLIYKIKINKEVKYFNIIQLICNLIFLTTILLF